MHTSRPIRRRANPRPPVGASPAPEMSRIVYLIDKSRALTISPHLPPSALKRASACADEPSIASNPISDSFLRTSGFLTVSLIAALSVAMICGSVLAGTKKPNQEAAVKPGKPDSANVGTSGVAATRLSAAMPRPFILPPVTCGAAPPPSVVPSGAIWLPSVPFIAGAPPWNGTCVASILAIFLKKYSAAIWEPLPTPADPKVMAFPFAALSKSASVLGVLPAPVRRDSGLDATIATVLKSAAENGLVSRKLSLMASAVVVTSSVYPSAGAWATAPAALFALELTLVSAP